MPTTRPLRLSAVFVTIALSQLVMTVVAQPLLPCGSPSFRVDAFGGRDGPVAVGDGFLAAMDGFVLTTYELAGEQYVPRGSVPITGPYSYRLIAVEGRLCYIAVGNEFPEPGEVLDIAVVDLTDLSSPQVVSRIPLQATSFVAKNGVLYVSAQNGTSIVDMSNPSTPVVHVPFSTSGGPIEVVGTLLYQTVGLLDIYDVHDPENVQRLVRIPGYSGSMLKAVGDHTLVIAGAFSGSVRPRIVDIRVPTAPVSLGELQITGVRSLQTLGDDLYVIAGPSTGPYTLYRYHIPAGGPATLRSSMPVEDPQFRGLGAGNGHVIVPHGQKGLTIFDPAEDGTPTVSQQITTFPDAIQLLSNGDAVYMLGIQGLHVRREGGTFLPEASIPLPSGCLIMHQDGNLLGVAAGLAGVFFIDISSPLAPVLAGHYQTTGWARAVALDGTLAYVYETTLGFQVIDAANPASPSLLGAVAVPGRATSNIEVEEDLVYLTGGFGDTFAFDVTEPSHPAIVRQYSLGLNSGVVIDGVLAHTSSNTLALVDLLTTPPASVFSYTELTGSASQVHVHGNTLWWRPFVGGTWLHGVDVTDPRHLRDRHAFILPSIGGAVLGTDDHLYIGHRLFSTEVRDLTLTPIVPPPASQLACIGGTVSFSVPTTTTIGPASAFRWYQDGRIFTDRTLPSGAVISGAATSTLTITNISPAEAGEYSVKVFPAANCYSEVTAPALLTICPSDFDCSGETDSTDFFSFLESFFAAHPHADIDASGGVDSSDFFAFLDAFFNPC